jgi:PAS domain S-box-containing protein
LNSNVTDMTRRAGLRSPGRAGPEYEASLRDSHARFEALFDASPVGMYLVDADLRIRMVSRTARPTFGDIGELIGRDFVEVMHILWQPKTADEIVARFRQTLETG